MKTSRREFSRNTATLVGGAAAFSILGPAGTMALAEPTAADRLNVVNELDSSSRELPMTERLQYLLSSHAVRERCHHVLDQTLLGRGLFQVKLEKLAEVSHFVLKVTRENYPDGVIPFHSRWSHFNANKIDRLGPLRARMGKPSPEERAVGLLDLVLVSVLLDAGAGPAWTYADTATNKQIARSEGLAVASLRMFEAGLFSADQRDPLRVDADALIALSREALAHGFQVSDGNPLVGLDGRLQLLKNLGKVLADDSIFRHGDAVRPGHLYHRFRELARGGGLPAGLMLSEVLWRFRNIWPGRLQWENTNLGDVWTSALLGPGGEFEKLVPFHKLSQWLTYSLMEPTMEAGVPVTDLNEMTGLAEYRNGGLLIDMGLIVPRDSRALESEHAVDSELVVQWRALTVALLDRVAEEMRTQLKKTPQELPLVRVLEGGTWWAGRRLAAEKRKDSSPPLRVISDGTVF